KETAELIVLGNDYYTRPRKIILVAPPSIDKILMAKEEPAHLHYRLSGEQTPLKGVRQRFENQRAGVGGENTSITVQPGTNVELTAPADRLIADQVIMRPPTKEERRGDVPVGNPLEGRRVRMVGDGRSFSLAFPEVTTPTEFILEFSDADSIRGRRHVW